MMKWFGAIALAGALMICSAVASSAVTAATTAQAMHATDLGARSHDHHRPTYVYAHHYAYRPYYPYYYGRPSYYSPGPFFPFLPFIHGWEEPWLW
jgi:hypothetical protein